MWHPHLITELCRHAGVAIDSKEETLATQGEIIFDLPPEDLVDPDEENEEPPIVQQPQPAQQPPPQRHGIRGMEQLIMGLSDRMDTMVGLVREERDHRIQQDERIGRIEAQLAAITARQDHYYHQTHQFWDYATARDEAIYDYHRMMAAHNAAGPMPAWPRPFRPIPYPIPQQPRSPDDVGPSTTVDHGASGDEGDY